MNTEITLLLERDHAAVDALFSEFKNASSSQQKHIYEQLNAELEAHTAAEEAVLYPEIARCEELSGKEQSSLKEHSKIRTALTAARKVMEYQEKFVAAVEMVQKAVEFHVNEEEEYIFPKLRQLWSAEKRLSLGVEIEVHKQNFAVAS